MDDHSIIYDKDAFTNRVLQFRKNGEMRIRSSGIDIDDILVKELASPGADHRNGVSLVARPSPEIVEKILWIQRHLQALEPQQYYYPASDLHLTVLEVLYGKSPEEANAMTVQMKDILPSVIHDLPTPVMEIFILGFDAKGCAINFVPQNQHFHMLRELLHVRLEKAGIKLQARYASTSAHVSILRYLAPLRTDKNHWADYLMDTPIEPNTRWEISSLSVTSGANWYGKQTTRHPIDPYVIK